MKTKLFPLFIGAVTASSPVLAAPSTVTLDVQNMTCAVCPLTVKKALEHVPGVQLVKVDFASKTARVNFDDVATTVEKLTESTKAAGYPSTIQGNMK